MCSAAATPQPMHSRSTHPSTDPQATPGEPWAGGGNPSLTRPNSSHSVSLSQPQSHAIAREHGHVSTEAVRFSHPFVSRLALMVLSRGLSARNCAIEVLAIGVPTGSAPSSARGGSRPMLYNTARVNAVARVAGSLQQGKNRQRPGYIGYTHHIRGVRIYSARVIR